MKIIKYLTFPLGIFICFASVYAQGNATFLPGDNIIQQGDALRPQESSVPDAQLYLPETFEQTDILPPLRRPADIPVPPSPKKPSIIRAGFNIGAQYGQFDTLPYSDIFFSPYMQIAWFYMSYDIPLRFDWTSAFVTALWTTKAALVSKITFDFQYSSTKTNTFFQRIGISVVTNQSISIGHGRFFYDYHPNLFGPYEVFKTLSFQMDTKYIGFNYLLANIAQPDLMAIELYTKPLSGIKNPRAQFLKDLKLYFVYGTDLDPFQSFSPGLYLFSPSSNPFPLNMIEAGVEFPLAQKKNIFDFMIYVDYAHIFGGSSSINVDFTIPSGSGLTGGFLMMFGQIVPIRFEVSQAFGSWQPRWVNEFYYIDRPNINQDGVIRLPKVQTTIPNLTYYNASLGVQLLKQNVFINLEIYGDFKLNDMWFKASLDMGQELLKFFTVGISWTVRNILKQGLGYSPNNTVLEISARYHMLPNMTWELLWKQSGMMESVFTETTSGNLVHTIDAKQFIFIGANFSYRY